MATTDWEKIRTEYVTGQIARRPLAKKHDVSYWQLERHAQAEGWSQLRKDFRRKTAAKGQEKAGDQAAEAMALIYKVGYTILERFLKAVEEGGLKLTPQDAARWATILKEMKEAGHGKTMIFERVDLSQMSDEQLDALIAGAGGLE